MAISFKRGIPDQIETLHPAYFALVMATGIVALALQLQHIAFLPTLLFWLNAVFLVVLVAATGVRILRHTQAFTADLRSYSRGVGFFTIVAALGVFGSQLELQMAADGLAVVVWLTTALLWLVMTYGIFAMLTVHRDKPGLDEGLNGGWLVSVVATQSVSILTVLVLPASVPAALQDPLMVVALAFWLGGGVLYLWLTTMIFLRYTFFRMRAEDLTPSYWINMGAAAISTLAGATLVEHAALSPVVTDLLPFVKGLTLCFWAVGSWWIPLLVILGLWRYLLRGVPFSYDPLYWGAVFPLGMYSVCSHHLADILHVSFLMSLSTVFLVFAVAAWIAALAGLVDSRLGSGSR
ncbi:tellurite resistance/C4-dicarboxylate transporter family protein [Oceanibacterium hippocampi]|uniref:Putative membrane protein/MT1776 n=1 Tax=Oceanibacterium hippocampi TaxID=745714 RepID=A0A1Y5TTH3_9PROT|nr:tellurite resistance/C4-dicarboxylate transporter family protein [Oceanibacterium hippocampi]SLN71188.1 putative membrane protein/MT1776 [Oceanibacterium hippocampi]